MCLCVCVCVCLRACVRACVRARACAHAHARAHAIYVHACMRMHAVHTTKTECLECFEIESDTVTADGAGQQWTKVTQ